MNWAQEALEGKRRVRHGLSLKGAHKQMLHCMIWQMVRETDRTP